MFTKHETRICDTQLAVGTKTCAEKLDAKGAL